MKATSNQIFLCIFVLLAVMLSASWAQMSDGHNDTLEYTNDTITSEQGEASQEAKVDSWWQERADTNKDGSVDDQELSAWKDLESANIDTNHDGQIDEQEKRTAWKYVRSPINTGLEQEFDTDNSGWLEPGEARKLLFRRAESIRQANGKQPIKTGLEKLYDTNGDGIIDLEELKTLREDLK